MSQSSNAITSVFIAWLIALVAMLATLYASEILNMPVCHLCWYQRIFMYPLVIFLGMSCFRNNSNIISYTLPFPIIGAVFALYQYLQQMIPAFAPIQLCGAGPACSDIHFKLLSFITFPFLSLVAFLLILFFLLIGLRVSHK